MRLVERVLCKVLHFVPDLVRDLFAYAAFQTAVYRGGNFAVFVRRFGLAVDEHDLFLDHVVNFFLAHHAANHIRLSEGVAGERLDDLHNLLLIHDTAVSGL